MDADLDTLLTELYVEIDDHVIAGRRGPGRPRRLADAGLAGLAARVLLGLASERRWLRFAEGPVPVWDRPFASVTRRQLPMPRSGRSPGR